MADRVTVGNTEIAMVWDAKFECTPSQFLASMPSEKWAAFGVNPDEVLESRVMTFLIRSQGKNILVDAGVGGHGVADPETEFERWREEARGLDTP